MTEKITIDFIIQYASGLYLAKKKARNGFKRNHLNAISFETRADAQKELDRILFKVGAKIIVRKCILG